jgi:hypothetical protein
MPVFFKGVNMNARREFYIDLTAPPAAGTTIDVESLDDAINAKWKGSRRNEISGARRRYSDSWEINIGGESLEADLNKSGTCIVAVGDVALAAELACLLSDLVGGRSRVQIYEEDGDAVDVTFGADVSTIKNLLDS